jgi:hypothetical protein
MCRLSSHALSMTSPGQAEERSHQAPRQRRALLDHSASLPPERRWRHPGPTGDVQAGETEQQRGPGQVNAVADQQDHPPTARAQQARSLARVLDCVSRPGLHQECRLRHAASERHPAHDFGFGHRPRTPTGEQQQRRGASAKQADSLIEPAGQSCRRAAAEHDDGVGPSCRYVQAPAVIASAPLMRAASAAARKRSRSPSSTAPVFAVSTPVRKSLTI